MIDHISLHLSDFSKGKAFYTKALAPLGYTITAEYPEWNVAAFGIDGKSDLWIAGDGTKQEMHVGFQAGSKEAVDGFYDAALKAGAKDNGAPGYRKDHSPGYYAAFIRDPDGHNIEAVFYDPFPEK